MPMKLAISGIEQILKEREEARQEERNALMQAITQAENTGAYLSSNYPNLAKIAKGLTPEQIVKIAEQDGLENLDYHLELCSRCISGSECYDPSYRYAGIVFAINGGELVETDCDKYTIYAEGFALQESGVGKRFLNCSLDNYYPTTQNQRDALHDVEDYANCLKTQHGITDKGLLIVGPVGTGKTHLAVSVIREAHRKGLKIAFAQVPQVLANIRAGIGRGDEDASSMIELYSNVDMLVLDDIGSEKVTDWVREQLFLIINRRYEALLPTVITSNDPLEKLEQHVGPRIASRLAGMCIGVVLDGPDYRLGGIAG